MQEFIIVSDAGLRVELADYGARIVDVQLPTERGLMSLICGYETHQHYLNDTAYVGATIGPIANRIRHGKMQVAGREIQLPANQNGHCLHSAELGFNYHHWEVIKQTTCLLKLRLESRDVLFGRLITTATFSVEALALRVEYECISEVPAYVNLTNHAYWNLNTGGENIKNHEFQLRTTGFAKKDAEGIPTGEVAPLSSPFKYCPNKATRQQAISGAVDHHFFAQQENQQLNQLCTVHSPQSEISLSISSTATGYQLYSGQFLVPPLTRFSGFCVEPQFAPNAINIPCFESPLTTPDSPYKLTILYQLSSSQV